jgi:hypothetical protein
MAVQIIGGTTSDKVAVNTDNEMAVALNRDPELSGFTVLACEQDDGSVSGTRHTVQLDATDDYAVRVAEETLLFDEAFQGSALNINTFSAANSTATIAVSGGYLSINSGNSVTTGQYVNVRTNRSFSMPLAQTMYFSSRARLISGTQANKVIEFGFGYPGTTGDPSDGVFFRATASGEFRCVVNNNGSEITSDPIVSVGGSPDPLDGFMHNFVIQYHYKNILFWIDDVLVWSTLAPTSGVGHSRINTLPVFYHFDNRGTPSVASRLEVASCAVQGSGSSFLSPPADILTGMGLMGLQGTTGNTLTSNANYANTAAPASATLSNTAAGYTTLGGQFQFAAVAGAETDYALFAFTPPAGSVTTVGKTLVVTGIDISCWNMGAASATTPTLLQWAIGVGATGVSLNLTEAQIPTVVNARRMPLGAMSLPVGAAIGTMFDRNLHIDLDTGLAIPGGRVFHIILKIPVGTATASQIIRGVVGVRSYWV